jgi:hypothetical protein
MKILPTAAGPVSLFRIVFGICLIAHIVWAYFPTVIHDNFIAPAFHFKFFLFSWVPVPPAPVLYGLLALALAAAAALAAGIFVRTAAATAGFCLTWFLLMDSSQFQNHYYFICLLCFLFALIPAQSEARWILHLFRFQFAVVYIFGGIAKLNPDWLAGKPMPLALAGLAEEPTFPAILATQGFALFLSWTGLVFDLLIVPALLWRRSRAAAMIALAVFHLTNLSFWGLGAFPWLMLAGTLVLFCPEETAGMLRRTPLALLSAGQATSPAPGRLTTGWITLWVMFQLLMPLRQHLYDGPTRWHQQGDYFSWTMKLNQYSHFTEIEYLNPATDQFEKVSFTDILTYDQRQTLHDPDHLLQLVHYIAGYPWDQTGRSVTAMRARTFLALNGEEFAPLIKQDANLLASERRFGPHDWVLPYPVRQ